MDPGVQTEELAREVGKGETGGVWDLKVLGGDGAALASQGETALRMLTVFMNEFGGNCEELT